MLLEGSDPIQIIMVSYFRPNDFLRSVTSVLNNTICPFHLSIIDNSHGGLDSELNTFKNNPQITIYRNRKNYGKGVAFNMRLPQIINKRQKPPYFISIDGDIEVPRGWLLRLKVAYQAVAHNEKPGIIAPAIMNEPGDTFDKQIKANDLKMHNANGFGPVHYHNGLYRNNHIAGPLLMIDKKLFKNVGGYYEGRGFKHLYPARIYSGDDVRLCMWAIEQNRFTGIDSNVHVLHLNTDTTKGYIAWKLRNVTKDVDHKGFWDQSDNQNNNDQ